MAIQFIAHRGSSFLAPENTLSAFRRGWKETTTCELDVRATLDGKLVVIHDASTRRTTGMDGKVTQRRWRELRKLDAGAWKGEEWKGERLPLLQEVLAAMPAGKRLLIEVKTGVKVVPELVRVIRASGKAERVAVHSFVYATCGAVKRALPRMPVYFLVTMKKKAGPWGPTVEKVLLKVRRAGLDGIGVSVSPLLNRAAVGKIHAAGLAVNVWTVDEVAEAKRLVRLGVDGIITNRPGWLKERV